MTETSFLLFCFYWKSKGKENMPGYILVYFQFFSHLSTLKRTKKTKISTAPPSSSLSRNLSQASWMPARGRSGCNGSLCFPSSVRGSYDIITAASLFFLSLDCKLLGEFMIVSPLYSVVVECVGICSCPISVGWINAQWLLPVTWANDHPVRHAPRHSESHASGIPMTNRLQLAWETRWLGGQYFSFQKSCGPRQVLSNNRCFLKN